MSSSQPINLCAKVNSASFFAELTEVAAELSEFSLRNSTLEAVLRPFSMISKMKKNNDD